jgi:hypothetical protein
MVNFKNLSILILWDAREFRKNPYEEPRSHSGRGLIRNSEISGGWLLARGCRKSTFAQSVYGAKRASVAINAIPINEDRRAIPLP